MFPDSLASTVPVTASFTLAAARLAFPTTPVGAAELSGLGSVDAGVEVAFALLLLVAGAGAGGSRCGRLRSSTILISNATEYSNT